MRFRLHSVRAVAAAFAALHDDPVPGSAASDERRDRLQRQLHRLAATWPFALVVLLAAPGLVWSAAASDAGAPAVARTALVCGGLLALLGGMLAVLLLPGVARHRPPHHSVAWAAATGAGIAALLLVLLRDTTTLAPGAYRLASFVGTFGAIVTTVVALYPVRAGMLGFGAGLVGTIAVQTGLGAATGVALGCLLCLALATYRLALRDRATVRGREQTIAQGRMATLLVAEFEAHSTGWFWRTDAHGRLTYLSPKVAAELDAPDAPAIGAALTGLFRMDSASSETERTLAFHLSARTAFGNYSVRPARLATTNDRWWSISGRPVSDSSGAFAGFVGSGSDLAERRRADAEITRLALFDCLTGLANRQRMRLSLEQALGPQRGGTQPRALTLFLLDLDRFKAVNDTLGHQCGDALLKQVAQRLQRAIGEAGLVGRLGGDEFEVILPGEPNRERLGELARRVIADLSHPYTIDGSSVTIGCSIGVAVAPEDGADAETLVRNADLALYAAKGDGRGIHRFFRGELLAGAKSRKRLEDDLREALAGDQFHIAYQPVVGTLSERIVGYEALLRWEHPTRGLVSPSEFIPVAEDCGLIEAIGEWVLRTACHEAAGWAGGIRVAVNVSPMQFANPRLPALVMSALTRSGLAADRLELEITEGVFLDETEATEQMFKALKGCGVRLALDDFGTGYSSLGYLKKAPFDKIKIDQSFVRGAATPGNRNAAIIKAIVTLADTLGMETTAEGVETHDEIALIRALGCSHIQGYVYGKAARAPDVLAQLAAAGGMATASGYRVSRAPRTTMFHSARIEAGGVSGEVRIRNISSTGALLDGVDVEEGTGELDLLIELLEGQMFPARLRWAEDGRAGVEFAETFNLERLAPVPGAVGVRKADRSGL